METRTQRRWPGWLTALVMLAALLAGLLLLLHDSQGGDRLDSRESCERLGPRGCEPLTS